MQTRALRIYRITIFQQQIVAVIAHSFSFVCSFLFVNYTRLTLLHIGWSLPQTPHSAEHIRARAQISIIDAQQRIVEIYFVCQTRSMYSSVTISDDTDGVYIEREIYIVYLNENMLAPKRTNICSCSTRLCEYGICDVNELR